MPPWLLAGCSTQPSSSEHAESLAFLPRRGLLPSVFFQDELPSLAPDEALEVPLSAGAKCPSLLGRYYKGNETLQHGVSAAPALLNGLMSRLNCFGEDLCLLHDLIVPVYRLVTWLG